MCTFSFLIRGNMIGGSLPIAVAKGFEIIFQPVQSVLLSPLCNYKAIHFDKNYKGSLMA